LAKRKKKEEKQKRTEHAPRGPDRRALTRRTHHRVESHIHFAHTHLPPPTRVHGPTRPHTHAHVCIKSAPSLTTSGDVRAPYRSPVIRTAQAVPRRRMSCSAGIEIAAPSRPPPASRNNTVYESSFALEVLWWDDGDGHEAEARNVYKSPYL